ncbi:uncharacterized protein METZ01_LOCUS472351, partial [marine metagenome]
IGDDYSGGNNIDQTLGSSDDFGYSVSLDGTLLAVGAAGGDGSGDSTSDSGEVYLYTFSNSTFSGGELDATIGAGYTGGSNVNESLESSDLFGTAVSLDGSQLAVGAFFGDGSGNSTSNSGEVYLYIIPSISTSISDAVFGTNAGDDLTLTTGTITTLLSAATNVVLQANNDITVSEAITAANGSGDGGNLTMQAGRSLLINANITTDNGNLILTANDTAGNGVVDAQRDSGAAVITLASGTTVNTG